MNSPQARGFPGPVRAAIVYLVFVTISVGGLLIYRLEPSSHAVQVLVSTIPYPMIFGIVLVLRGLDFAPFDVGDFPVAVRQWSVIWLVLLAVAAGLFIITREYRGHSGLHYVQRFLTYPVLDPLAEEFAFRGAIQTALRNTRAGRSRFLHIGGAIWLTAVLFAAIHIFNLLGNQSVSSSLIATASALPAGLIFGVVYDRKRNIWFGVMLHGISNLLMG